MRDFEVRCMLSFQLDALSSKELYKDVLVRLVSGDELTLDYFELKNENVEIPFHEHPVEHLVVVLEGEMELMFEDQKLILKKRECLFEDQKLILKKRECLFVPAKTRHTGRVIHGPVKALEIYPATEDEYYKR